MSYAIAATMALEAWNGLSQAESIREGAAINQRINELNAKYAEIDAYEAEKYGFTQSARYQTQIDQTLSEQRSAMASKDIDVSFGTAAEIQADSKVAGFLNTIDIQNAAHRRAMGLKTQASNFRIQGAMGEIQSETSASAAQRQGLVNAGIRGISGFTRGGGYKGRVPDDNGDFSTSGESYVDRSGDV